MRSRRPRSGQGCLAGPRVREQHHHVRVEKLCVCVVITPLARLLRCERKTAALWPRKLNVLPTILIEGGSFTSAVASVSKETLARRRHRRPAFNRLPGRPADLGCLANARPAAQLTVSALTELAET